jgi:predicted aspartyl protease
VARKVADLALMTGRVWLAGCILLIAIASPVLAQPVPDEPAVREAPLLQTTAPPDTVQTAEDEANRMTVPVMVNGRGPFQFVVDTGSNRTVISDALAAALNLPAGPTVTLHSAVASGSASTVRIDSLQVGSRQITNVVAPVLTRGNLGAAGMLGIDALHDQKIVMDFRARRMTIQASFAEPDEPGVFVVHGRSRLGQLVFVDAHAGGVPLYVIIDTGGQMTIGNSVLRSTLLRRRAVLSTAIEVTSVTGDRIAADMMIMPRISLGDMTVGNMPIGYADMHAFTQFGLQNRPSMLLGMDLLRVFDKVSVDFKKREVRFVMKE